MFCAKLGELGTHLAALVQLLKAGLEDARNVFRGDGESRRGRSDRDMRKAHEVHLLELHAEGIRLDFQVNTDFVRFIRAFLERLVLTLFVISHALLARCGCKCRDNDVVEEF